MTVVLEHSTKSLATFDHSGNGSSIVVRFDQFVAESLMNSLCMVVHDVFANGILKRLRSEEDPAIQTL